jgi:hypothetical protein
MGLMAAVYGFGGAIPPCERLEEKLLELFPDQLSKEGTVGPASNDEQCVPNPQRPGATLLMRSTHLTFRVKGDPQRWSRWLNLTVSLDGEKLSVVSNYPALFRSACEELRILGGILYVP